MHLYNKGKKAQGVFQRTQVQTIENQVPNGSS